MTREEIVREYGLDSLASRDDAELRRLFGQTMARSSWYKLLAEVRLRRTNGAPLRGGRSGNRKGKR